MRGNILEIFRLGTLKTIFLLKKFTIDEHNQGIFPQKSKALYFIIEKKTTKEKCKNV